MRVLIAGTSSIIIHIILSNLFLPLFYLPADYSIKEKNLTNRNILLVDSGYRKKETKPTNRKKEQKKVKIEKTEPQDNGIIKKIWEKKKVNNNIESSYNNNENKPSENPEPSVNNVRTKYKDKKKSTLIFPIYKNTPSPFYPKFAKKKGYQGTTFLEALVDTKGKVKDIRVNKTSGYEILDKAAVDAVKKWLFIPASIGNNKTEIWVKIPIKFEIKN